MEFVYGCSYRIHTPPQQQNTQIRRFVVLLLQCEQVVVLKNNLGVCFYLVLVYGIIAADEVIQTRFF